MRRFDRIASIAVVAVVSTRTKFIGEIIENEKKKVRNNEEKYRDRKQFAVRDRNLIISSRNLTYIYFLSGTRNLGTFTRTKH